MTAHSHSQWKFGDPVTDELIDEIAMVMESARGAPCFAILSQVDKLALLFSRPNFNIDEMMNGKANPEPIKKQLKEIYELLMKKKAS